MFQACVQSMAVVQDHVMGRHVRVCDFLRELSTRMRIGLLKAVLVADRGPGVNEGSLAACH